MKDTAQLCHVVARAWARSRRFILAAETVFALALAAFAPAAAAHAQGRCADAHMPIAGASRTDMQRSVVCLINQQRTERHLPRLRINQRLNRSAQGWTNVMVRDRDFSHGSDFSARISAVGFNWSEAGENIATGFRTPATVVRAWMASTGHCQNILSPNFLDVGTGVSDRSIAGFSSGAGTWTQDFALPMGTSAPSGNASPADGCPDG